MAPRWLRTQAGGARSFGLDPSAKGDWGTNAKLPTGDYFKMFTTTGTSAVARGASGVWGWH